MSRRSLPTSGASSEQPRHLNPATDLTGQTSSASLAHIQKGNSEESRAESPPPPYVRSPPPSVQTANAHSVAGRHPSTSGLSTTVSEGMHRSTYPEPLLARSAPYRSSSSDSQTIPARSGLANDASMARPASIRPSFIQRPFADNDSDTTTVFSPDTDVAAARVRGQRNADAEIAALEAFYSRSNMRAGESSERTREQERLADLEASFSHERLDREIWEDREL